jgi:hypothetical protein
MASKRKAFKADGRMSKSIARQFRMVNLGLYSGPRMSVQRYNVAEQSSDAINRAVRTPER